MPSLDSIQTRYLTGGKENPAFNTKFTYRVRWEESSQSAMIAVGDVSKWTPPVMTQCFLLAEVLTQILSHADPQMMVWDGWMCIHGGKERMR